MKGRLGRKVVGGTAFVGAALLIGAVWVGAKHPDETAWLVVLDALAIVCIAATVVWVVWLARPIGARSFPGDKPRELKSDDPALLDFTKYLWAEYQYRHDMVWKLAFRITAVAAALLIAPFLTRQPVQKAVNYGLAGLPFLAIVVIAGGLFTLQSELSRLDLIRDAYRVAQEKLFGPYVGQEKLEQLRSDRRKKSETSDQPEGDRQRKELHFDQRVQLYFVVLLILASIYFVLFVSWWIHNLVDQAGQPQPAESSAAATSTVEPLVRLRSGA